MIESNKILCGDALTVLKSLPSDSIHCCVTSPPYYGLRDYGINGQIGLEQTPGAYITRLTEVFHEVQRVLTPDGTLWLNIGDCYAGSGKGAGDWDKKSRSSSKHRYLYALDNPAAQLPKRWPDIKPKDLIGIPWTLAFALRSDGWYLRSDIIWHKPNCMPHPVKDRPVNSYEHVFLLAKSKKYFFDYTALEVPLAPGSAERYQRGFYSTKYTATAGNVPGQSPQAITLPRKGGPAPAVRRGRDVWTTATNNYRAAHFATYPTALVKPCILAGCPQDGIVLDPFFGAGTTGVAALELGRQYLGIEINPAFCEIAEKRLKERRESSC